MLTDHFILTVFFIFLTHFLTYHSFYISLYLVDNDLRLIVETFCVMF